MVGAGRIVLVGARGPRLVRAGTSTGCLLCSHVVPAALWFLSSSSPNSCGSQA